MVAVIVGILFIAFTVLAVLPIPRLMNWGPQVIAFLQGGAPVLAGIIGLIAVFIGIADIKDRIEAKKEEASEAAAKTEEKSE